MNREINKQIDQPYKQIDRLTNKQTTNQWTD